MEQRQIIQMMVSMRIVLSYFIEKHFVYKFIEYNMFHHYVVLNHFVNPQFPNLLLLSHLLTPSTALISMRPNNFGFELRCSSTSQQKLYKKLHVLVFIFFSYLSLLFDLGSARSNSVYLAR